MIKVSIIGAAGKMGRCLLEIISLESGYTLVNAVEKTDHPALGKRAGSLVGVDNLNVQVTTLEETTFQDEVVIDFSLPGTLQHFLPVIYKNCQLVCGTTGINDTEQNMLREYSGKMPILYASNMSVGINLLMALLPTFSRHLEDFDAEITEIHHLHKVDAPSGTAISLADKIVEGDDKRAILFPRGEGARQPGQIGIASLRGGDVPGTHTVYFLGKGESLELTHRTGSREILARGALRAAKWIAGKKPGFYSMQELFL